MNIVHGVSCDVKREPCDARPMTPAATASTAAATSAPAARRPRSPRGRGAVLRDELVRAATALLDRAGDPDAVTIRGVAAEVGVAPTAIYLHFADRDELMVTVVEERFAEFHRTIEE